MMTRRLLALLLAAAVLLSACGEVAPESLAFATSETEETVIRFATPRISGFEDVIADWEREHPTARVEIVVRNIDDHHRSLLGNSTTGGPFDIVAFDASYGAEVRARGDLFVDLSMHDATPPASDYLDSRWIEGISDEGETIGLPLDIESAALLVRSDLVGENVVEDLEAADSWCDVLVVGDAFSDETNTAFLADGDDLLAAILAQTRTSFVDEEGVFVESELPELKRAWDLTMIAIGEGPLHGDPCPGVDDIQRIARNLPFDSSEWQRKLGDQNFAAIVAPWSYRRRIANASPQTAGQWVTIDLPTDAPAPDAGSSSDGGLHLGLHGETTHFDLAYDLLLTLTDPAIQVVAFADGTGPLPAAAQPHTSGTIGRADDDFFADSSVKATYSRAAMDLESGGQTPDEAWTSARDQVSKALD